MSWFTCPVCSQNNPPKTIRCSACGADFSDPDVMAMMGEDPSSVMAPEVDAGSLAHGKFFGFSRDGLETGNTVRLLAGIGSLMLLAGFLMPVSVDYRESLFAWKALDHAPSIPLMFPALAAIMGLAAAFAPLQNWQRSLTLLIAGVVGLGTLPFLGGFSGSPENFMPLITVGVVLAAWGLVLRSFDPKSDLARKLVVGAGVLTAIGFFIPMSGADNAIPIELRFYLKGEVGSASPFTMYKTVFNRDPLVFFSTIYLFLPLLLIPVGAALAWPKPKEAWDKLAIFIKPIAWMMVVYAPMGLALFAFNLFDNSQGHVVIDNSYMRWEDFTSAALKGRFRMLLLATGFSLWATLPFIGVLKHFAKKGAPEGEASGSTGEASASAGEAACEEEA